jgi:cell division transport system ATP-binding protein
MIIFKNVTKKYPGNVLAIDNVSFEINGGEFVFLVGRSGAGKTTILKILRREIEPTKGQVFFKNKNILEIPKRKIGKIRRKIAAIHQDFKLLNKKTVFENIALPLEIIGKSPSEIRKKVLEIAEKLNLESKLNQIAETLSGGEKQKVCLARCMATEPEVILADEPTGNLDPIASYEIMEILKSLNKSGITIIVATHSRELVESFKTRVITLSEGRLIRDENPGKFSLV